MPANIINIKVVSPNNDDVVFKLRTNTPLDKLMSKYADTILNKKVSKVSFVYDGQKIKGKDTPQSLGMVDGDIIQIEDSQKGGGY